jgi:hypothetical protein
MITGRYQVRESQGAHPMAFTTRQITSNILGLIGAAVGGVLGYYIFRWILDQGFYGLMIPGAVLGLGCGLLSRHASQLRGVLCAAAGLVLGMYAEWSYSTFVADESFRYLVLHIYEKRPLTLVMLALGAFFAYWLGRDGGIRKLPGQGQAASTRKLDSPPSK